MRLPCRNSGATANDLTNGCESVPAPYNQTAIELWRLALNAPHLYVGSYLRTAQRATSMKMWTNSKLSSAVDWIKAAGHYGRFESKRSAGRASIIVPSHTRRDIGVLEEDWSSAENKRVFSMIFDIRKLARRLMYFAYRIGIHFGVYVVPATTTHQT